MVMCLNSPPLPHLHLVLLRLCYCAAPRLHQVGIFPAASSFEGTPTRSLHPAVPRVPTSGEQVDSVHVSRPRPRTPCYRSQLHVLTLTRTTPVAVSHSDHRFDASLVLSLSRPDAFDQGRAQSTTPVERHARQCRVFHATDFQEATLELTRHQSLSSHPRHGRCPDKDRVTSCDEA